jgi:hypothetical protein
MRCVKSCRRRRLMALTLMTCLGGAAIGAPLNPLDFPLAGGTGAFPTTPGIYGFNFDDPIPTITASGYPGGPSIPGGISIPGTVFTDVQGNRIAVFDFVSLTIGSTQSFIGCSSRIAPFCTPSFPVALLSRSDVTVNGVIDVSGATVVAGLFTAPGPGGGAGGPPPPSGRGDGGGPGGGSRGGGGGGFGGVGGDSGIGASGGRTYGDLALLLEGGSGGGGAGLNGDGGGGGGAIEIGALGAITVAGGGVHADGGNAISDSFGSLVGAGGGSGGGIFLHGDSVQLLSVVSARGGRGHNGGLVIGGPVPPGAPIPFEDGPGGGGGGGRLLIQFGAGGLIGTDLADVSGGVAVLVLLTVLQVTPAS